MLKSLFDQQEFELGSTKGRVVRSAPLTGVRGKIFKEKI